MPTGPCAVCGTSAKAFCSKCKQVYYCCAEHQRQDWKSHKAACKAFCEAGGAAGPSSEQAPEPSGGGGTCARCLEPCGKGKCCVPHPVHLREFGGGFYGAGGMQFSYACGACSQSYTEVTPSGSTAPPKITGAVWCFDGRHSAGPLPAGDKRRVFRNAVTLTAGANLQRQIDELPADTEILNIVSTGTFDDKNRVALARPLPNLTELHLVDVAFSRVVLTAETTPKLHTLQMQNVPESCELEVVLPELRDVTVHYWGGDAGVMERMLQAATKLEEFDSYKLWSNNELTFASAALRSINLHRADTLGSLTVWAPNLVNLNLQARKGVALHSAHDQQPACVCAVLCVTSIARPRAVVPFLLRRRAIWRRWSSSTRTSSRRRWGPRRARARSRCG